MKISCVFDLLSIESVLADLFSYNCNYYIRTFFYRLADPICAPERELYSFL